MAKNLKKKKSPAMAVSSRRLKEKLNDAMRGLDLLMAGLVVVIIVCVLIGRCGEYELGKDNNYGFALWFLLIPAYLILELFLCLLL